MRKMLGKAEDASAEDGLVSVVTGTSSSTGVWTTVLQAYSFSYKLESEPAFKWATRHTIAHTFPVLFTYGPLH